MSRKFIIPESFLLDVYSLLDELDAIPLPQYIQEQCSALQLQIEDKYASLSRRALFSEYKTSKVGSDRREALRSMYLDHVGVPHSFRTEEEMPL
jgi:hypothetical protein